MHSDSDDNVGRVGADDGDTQAEIRVPSSAVRPHAEDKVDSSEDEVVWKGRSTGRTTRLPTKRSIKSRTTPGGTPSVDPAPDHRARRSEAAKNRMRTPSYSYPYSSGLYQPYAQPFWSHAPTYPSIYPPTYPLSYPPAYPRFYASPYVAPTSRAPEHDVQRAPEIERSSSAVHLKGKFRHDATITRDTQSEIKTPVRLHGNKTTTKNTRKATRSTPSFKTKVRPRVGSKRHKKFSSASQSHVHFVDTAHMRESSSKAKTDVPPGSYIAEDTAEPSDLVQRDFVYSEPVFEYDEPWEHPVRHTSIRKVHSEPSFAARKSEYFVPHRSTFPTPVLAPPLHTDRRELLDQNDASQSISPGSGNGENELELGFGDRLVAQEDVLIAGAISQQDPKPEVNGQINRFPRQSKLDDLVISVTVQSSHASSYSQVPIPSHMKWPGSVHHGTNVTMDVKKAVTAKRLKRMDGSYSMELYCNKGPSVHGDYQIQWLHMKTRHLDLPDFENACLNAPGISGKARLILLRLFEQIQIKHREQLFDGYYIQPGTVLRCDGSSSGDPNTEQPSAVFMCFPYLSVATRKEAVHLPELGYPTRSILQTLYPYESTTFREEPPSFCSHLTPAADRVLCVPQCWIVILDSHLVISSAELTGTEIMDSAILHSNHDQYFPPVTSHQGQDRQSARHSIRHDSAAADNNSMDPLERIVQEKTKIFAEIFGGIHVEDYLIEDDESDDFSTTNTSDVSLDRVGTTTPPSTSDNILHQPHSTADASSGAICSPALNHAYDTLENSSTHPWTSQSPLADVTLGTLPTYRLNDSQEPQLESFSSVMESPAEVEAFILTLLNTLEPPQMTSEYLTRFCRYIGIVLDLWDAAPQEARRRQLGILERLHNCKARADILRSICDLGSQTAVFVSDFQYREAIIKAVLDEDSSSQKELESLRAVVADAMTLFKSVSYYNTTHAIRSAKKALRKQRRMSKPGASKKEQSPELISKLARENLKPFLTWVMIDAELDQEEKTEAVAAEYLQAMMRRIEKNLSESGKNSYHFARELSLSDLQRSLIAPMPDLLNMTSDVVVPSHQHIPSQLEPCIATAQAYPLEDPVLEAQKRVVRATIDDLFVCLKRFVELYVPCNYSHSVCHKIWGTMAQLNHSATLLIKEDSKSTKFYMIRPLEIRFRRSHRIEKPTTAIQSCSDCKFGRVYRSQQDAMIHLNEIHYMDRPSGRQQVVRRYFVRSENDVRNERVSKQQLQLLQTCIAHFEELVARGEKLYFGIAEGKQRDRRRYQLPDGLIDCFEETVLLLMQATACMVAIRNEAVTWRHTHGNTVENFNLESSATKTALRRLGTMGDSGRASMTKAEKAIRLAVGEDNMGSMGSAGPELLVSIVLQNIAKRHPLDDVQMDVNQLYQEYISKLQYQINKSPRKRLLRAIHKLQEEVSVVKLVNSWQQKTLTSLLRVLDPDTFRKPTKDRRNMYIPESECISNNLVILQAKAVELEAFENRAQYLREQLRQSVEILEEDHGKAILVFTMITTIFLPLSFVTSFFGMNMSDIRDTDSTQAFFWAIAIPVTAGIVFAAVFLAYRGDKLYDTIVQAAHELKEQQRRKHVQKSPFHNRGTWRDAFAFVTPSWALRRQGKPNFAGVKFDTSESSTGSQSTVTI